MNHVAAAQKLIHDGGKGIGMKQASGGGIGFHLARRLLQAGVSTELHAYPGTFHGSGLVADAPVSQQGARDTMNALRRALVE